MTAQCLNAMSKRFKNKRCVYCGAVSATADHVIAREFFPPNLRGNLPKVPACDRCNRKKSDLEHYLVMVLPGGGEHPAASAALDRISARLGKNRALARELGAGARELPGGGGMVPLRADAVTKYMCFVVKGLIFHHFNVVVSDRFRVEGAALRTGFAEGLEQMHRKFGGRMERIEATHADGAFEYVGHFAREFVPLSIWQMRLYGRISMAGEGDGMTPSAFEFGAIVMLAKPPRPFLGTGWG